VRQDHAARNMTLSGNYFTAQAQLYARNAELLAQARVYSLLDAYKKSGAPLDDTAFAEIRTEATQFCEQQGRNIVQALTNGIGQSFGNQAPGGFREAISGQVVSQISGVSARVTRKLSILQDETKLAARNSAASQTAAQTGSRQSTPTDSAGFLAAPEQILHAKPHLYYWRFLLEFGQECYRTWRWELLASFVVSFVTYLITTGEDALAWRNFQIAFVATALTLAGFALWHLLRTPWLVHRGLQSTKESTPHWAFGIVGIAVLSALIAGAFVSVAHLRQVPPPLVKFTAPPPPVMPVPQPQPKLDSKRPSSVVPHAPSAQPDRILTDQQADHLYQELKEFASDPNHADLISITVAPYAYQDLESAHVTYQLSRIFQYAHWKVLRQAQSPIKLEGSAQHQIPIGIWILTSRDQNYGYFLWSALKEVGLDSSVRPKSDVPADFVGKRLDSGYRQCRCIGYGLQTSPCLQVGSTNSSSDLPQKCLDTRFVHAGISSVLHSALAQRFQRKQGDSHR
jgi:hypothetical protein